MKTAIFAVLVFGAVMTTSPALSRSEVLKRIYMARSLPKVLKLPVAKTARTAEETEEWGEQEDVDLYFRIFDSNNDGKLSHLEIWGYLEAVGIGLEQIDSEVGRIFNAGDSNTDGVLSKTEVQALMKAGFF